MTPQQEAHKTIPIRCTSGHWPYVQILPLPTNKGTDFSIRHLKLSPTAMGGLTSGQGHNQA